MNKEYRHSMTAPAAACLAAVLAVPLAACGERPEEQPEADQPGALQLAREKEAERRPGAGEPELNPGDADYTDEYAEPRESWTGGASGDAVVTDVAATDARAMQQLRETLAGREGMGGVEVEVTDGIAHLTGEVDSWARKRQAEDIVTALEEVAEVRNDLQVSSEGGT